jgi:hypothetical protein
VLLSWHLLLQCQRLSMRPSMPRVNRGVYTEGRWMPLTKRSTARPTPR